MVDQMRAIRALYENHPGRDDGLAVTPNEVAHCSHESLRLITVG